MGKGLETALLLEAYLIQLLLDDGACIATRFVMTDHSPLSPEDLAALFKRLDALIDEARSLQRHISERLVASRRGDQQDRTGQPERRRRARKPPTKGSPA